MCLIIKVSLPLFSKQDQLSFLHWNQILNSNLIICLGKHFRLLPEKLLFFVFGFNNGCCCQRHQTLLFSDWICMSIKYCVGGYIFRRHMMQKRKLHKSPYARNSCQSSYVSYKVRKLMHIACIPLLTWCMADTRYRFYCW